MTIDLSILNSLVPILLAGTGGTILGAYIIAKWMLPRGIFRNPIADFIRVLYDEGKWPPYDEE